MDFNDPLGVFENPNSDNCNHEIDDKSYSSLKEVDNFDKVSINDNISESQSVTDSISEPSLNSYKNDISSIKSSINEDTRDNSISSICNNENTNNNSYERILNRGLSTEVFSNDDTADINYELGSCEQASVRVPCKLDDLKIVVDSPEKHCTKLDAFITFKITVKSSRPEFLNREISVRRRYNDFLWLYQKLERDLSHYILPVIIEFLTTIGPLPEKHNLKMMDKFDADFIKTRCRGLFRFLNRIGSHPSMSFHPSFIGFISFNQTEFQNIKKDKSGFLDRISMSLTSKKTSLTIRSRPEKFNKLNIRINSLNDKLCEVDRISHKIHKEQLELLEHIGETIPIYNLWMNIEQDLQPTIDNMAKSSSVCYTSLESLISDTVDNFSFNIREYCLYTGCVKDALMKRDVTQNEDDISNRTNKQANENNQLSDKEQDDTDSMKNRSEFTHNNMIKADEIIVSETKRWDAIRCKDFKNVFIELADSQINYYKNCLNAWESMLLLMQRKNESKNVTN